MKECGLTMRLANGTSCHSDRCRQSRKKFPHLFECKIYKYTFGYPGHLAGRGTRYSSFSDCPIKQRLFPTLQHECTYSHIHIQSIIRTHISNTRTHTNEVYACEVYYMRYTSDSQPGFADHHQCFGGKPKITLQNGSCLDSQFIIPIQIHVTIFQTSTFSSVQCLTYIVLYRILHIRDHQVIKNYQRGILQGVKAGSDCSIPLILLILTCICACTLCIHMYKILKASDRTQTNISKCVWLRTFHSVTVVALPVGHINAKAHVSAKQRTAKVVTKQRRTNAWIGTACAASHAR